MNFGNRKSQDDTIVAPISHTSNEIKYFGGIRRDYLAELPTNCNARILEIGCATGNTGCLAIKEGKCGYYCGVEICREAAEVAKRKISDVIVADVEKLVPPWPKKFFDILILSEVLEHLCDPWFVLRKLHPHMKPGAQIFASSPNVSHYKIILMLLGGQWRLANKGPMDRTHLRWFTPQSFREMFESCGYHVYQVRAVSALRRKAKMAALILGRRREFLFWRQIDLRARS